MKTKTLSILSKIISYLFHPLFIPTYFFIYLTIVMPYEFTGITDWQLKLKIFSVFWMTAFFPAFGVFLLYKLKLSDSIYLRTQKERIIPYVIVMFFYWWMYYLSRNFTDQPVALKHFYLGIFVASAIGLVVNNFQKVSMHAMGVAGMLTAVMIVGSYTSVNNLFWIVISIVVTSLVVSARMIVSNHTNKELITGFAIGVMTQLIAYFWVI